MKPKFYKWASSPTLDGIQASITKFYCGSTITLTPVSETEWSVSNRNGLIHSVHVVLKRGRYIFQDKAAA